RRGEGPHERRRKADHAPAPSRIGREITGRNGLRRALGERRGARRRGRAAHLLRPSPRQGSPPAHARRREVQRPARQAPRPPTAPPRAPRRARASPHPPPPPPPPLAPPPPHPPPPPAP